MTLTVVTLTSREGEDAKVEALAVLDRLRADVESGEVSCFVGVTIDDDDNVRTWSGATKRVSRLRSMGAIAHLQACLHNGEV